MLFKFSTKRRQNIFDGVLIGVILAAILWSLSLLKGSDENIESFSSEKKETISQPAKTIEAEASGELKKTRDSEFENPKTQESNESIPPTKYIDIGFAEYEFLISNLRTLEIYEVEIKDYFSSISKSEFFWEYKVTIEKNQNKNPGRCKLDINYPLDFSRNAVITITSAQGERDWFMWGDENIVEITINSIISSKYSFATSKSWLSDFGLEVRIICEGDKTQFKNRQDVIVFFT